MAVHQLTFKQYVAEEGTHPPVNFWWRGLIGRPDNLEPKQLLDRAGVADVPLAHLSCGYLETAWQGHPRRAFVITTSVGFHPGDRYAISLEPDPSH